MLHNTGRVLGPAGAVPAHQLPAALAALGSGGARAAGPERPPRVPSHLPSLGPEQVIEMGPMSHFRNEWVKK